MSANGSNEGAGVKKDESKQRLNSYSAALASAPAVKPASDGPTVTNGRGPPKKSFSDANKNKNRERNDSSSNNWRAPNVASGDRRNSYKNGGTNGKSKSADKNFEKRRMLSSTGKSLEDDENGSKNKDRLRSTNSNGKQRHRTSNSGASNGESFDIGDDFDLDEPFSDSDDDAPFHREIQKPSLQIPRGRIRTLSGTVPPVGFSPKWGGPTMCLSCLEFFDLPDDISKFSDHLLSSHKIVVKEIEHIVDPKRYIEHWRQRFATESVEKIFPKVVPTADSPYHEKVDFYYELSETIPEDYSLRQRLAMRRLEEALSCQQRERDEVSFSMQCVFCRYVARGNRAKLIHHLYMIHHLNLGSPDNLVFVHEYLEHLREKLLRNECIYCEKVFTDRNILMDHMRKRNHREVNPKNDYYDKFYIINYLELGKRWLDVLAEDFEDTMPSFQDSDDEEEDLEWHEWQEDNTDEDQLRVICLFCDDSHDKVAPLLTHLNDRHKFDLVGYIEKEKLDTYGRMKLINHLRKEIFNTPNFRAKVQAADGVVDIPEREKWDTTEDLVPMFANDHLLWMLESYLDEHRPELAGHEVTVAEDAPVVERLIAESKANTVDGVVPDDLPLLRGNEPEKEELRELARAIRNVASFD